MYSDLSGTGEDDNVGGKVNNFAILKFYFLFLYQISISNTAVLTD